ncbi:16S rRNA (uracil(1498)-N(3))-methyltransferase [uncultured Nevskia sp.]|uniref:16S rRNA (uracil(1498)-N(3))-methyltransferase n=1 Tax=uncultured Nevskia sp. TaxID=228950 RepID=UPI0025D4AFBD|nr:16S rRNA (uracil(1498)-N(3))-methyltransferase [uncultured Nevskia sp.]
MTRIHIPVPLTVGASLDLPDDAARHVAQVLRMKIGEPLTLFNGDSGEYAATITATGRRDVSVSVDRFEPVDRESRLDITLAQCVSKGERMDYTVQKAVELGVTRILPLLSERSVVKLDAERWDKKLEHWRGIAVSACEQSGRTRLPEVLPVQKLEAWLASSDQALRLVLAPTESVSLRSLPAATKIALLIGPEGGLSDNEIAAARRAGCVGIGLGPRVLRTETAGVAALAALQLLWGDLG